MPQAVYVHSPEKEKKSVMVPGDILELFAEGEVNITRRQSRGDYSTIFTSLSEENCFRIIAELNNRE